MKGLKIRTRLPNEPIPYTILLEADETEEIIDKYIHECEILLIEKDQQLIGVCAYEVIDVDSVEIKNIALIDDHRNRGIGSWIMGILERTLPYKTFLVGTGDHSYDAIRFYKKNGYEIAFTRSNFFIDHYPKPIYENGAQLKDQVVLKKTIAT